MSKHHGEFRVTVCLVMVRWGGGGVYAGYEGLSFILTYLHEND